MPLKDFLGLGHTIVDEQSRLRIFYLRALLAFGLLWGAGLLIQLPFVVLSMRSSDTLISSFLVVLNSMTIAPACLLAFWHRRVACIWLVLNAVLFTAYVADFILRAGELPWGLVLVAAVSIFLAICLVTIEIKRWPGALAQNKG